MSRRVFVVSAAVVLLVIGGGRTTAQTQLVVTDAFGEIGGRPMHVAGIDLERQ